MVEAFDSMAFIDQETEAFPTLMLKWRIELKSKTTFLFQNVDKRDRLQCVHGGYAANNLAE